MSADSMILTMAREAREAAVKMAICGRPEKDRALEAIAAGIQDGAAHIKRQNQKDLEAAIGRGLSAAMLDRLTVDDDVIAAMVRGLREVAALEDPIGGIIAPRLRPNGLEVSRMRIPIGVVGIIYESRPNVTIDSAGLCLKAGNAVVLRGGSEALRSNQALADIIQKALQAAGLPGKAVQLVPIADRSAVQELLLQAQFIDLIIPRGGEGLIRFVTQHSRIPVLKHYKGVCHVYVDADADVEMAAKICFNAKVQRPGVCNAMETLLVHGDIAPRFLPAAARRLVASGVELRGCPLTREILSEARPASSEDWATEFLDLILAVKIVPDMDAAMAHIARYGSNHTEVIVTKDYARARRFVRQVDASAVMVNASTRFNDGGQLGLGAEIGISTSKLHAYGPMGLEELTATKFVVLGDGQVRT